MSAEWSSVIPDSLRIQIAARARNRPSIPSPTRNWHINLKSFSRPLILWRPDYLSLNCLSRVIPPTALQTALHTVATPSKALSSQSLSHGRCDLLVVFGVAQQLKRDFFGSTPGITPIPCTALVSSSNHSTVCQHSWPSPSSPSCCGSLVPCVAAFALSFDSQRL